MAGPRRSRASARELRSRCDAAAGHGPLQASVRFDPVGSARFHRDPRRNLAVADLPVFAIFDYRLDALIEMPSVDGYLDLGLGRKGDGVSGRGTVRCALLAAESLELRVTVFPTHRFSTSARDVVEVEWLVIALTFSTRGVPSARALSMRYGLSPNGRDFLPAGRFGGRASVARAIKQEPSVLPADLALSRFA